MPGVPSPCAWPAGGSGARAGSDLPCCCPADQHILRELEKKKILVFTPSRRVGGKRVVCYDDRFIVKLAFESDGVVVSNDTYRDLQSERQEWKRFIEERLLMYSFVNDKYGPGPRVWGPRDWGGIQMCPQVWGVAKGSSAGATALHPGSFGSERDLAPGRRGQAGDGPGWGVGQKQL